MNDSLRILSLGWGVQSWTIAAMMAKDVLPRADYLVFADTLWEKQETYEHMRRWTPWLGEHGLNVVTVQAESTAVIERWKSDTAGIMIPAHTLAQDGTKGQIGRQCTATWKIRAIRRFATKVLQERGLPKTPGAVTSVQGISWDEALRMKDSKTKYIVHEYPLVDRRITRRDCQVWLLQNALPVPPKSGCVFCPFQTQKEWRDLGRRGGVDYETAVAVDQEIRHTRDKFLIFVHPSCRPLEEAVVDDGQMELWPDATCDSGHCFS